MFDVIFRIGSVLGYLIFSLFLTAMLFEDYLLEDFPNAQYHLLSGIFLCISAAIYFGLAKTINRETNEKTNNWPSIFIALFVNAYYIFFVFDYDDVQKRNDSTYLTQVFHQLKSGILVSEASYASKYFILMKVVENDSVDGSVLIVTNESAITLVPQGIETLLQTPPKFNEANLTIQIENWHNNNTINEEKFQNWLEQSLSK